MNMNISHWNQRMDGRVLIGPALSWETAVAPRKGLLRLCYSHSEDVFDNGGPALQVTLTADQARALSEDLRQLAEALEEERVVS